MSKASEMQFFVQKGEAVDSVWLVGCIAIMSPLHDTETPQSHVVQCTTKGSFNDSLLCPFLAHPKKARSVMAMFNSNGFII